MKIFTSLGLVAAVTMTTTLAAIDITPPYRPLYGVPLAAIGKPGRHHYQDVDMNTVVIIGGEKPKTPSLVARTHHEGHHEEHKKGKQKHQSLGRHQPKIPGKPMNKRDEHEKKKKEEWEQEREKELLKWDLGSLHVPKKTDTMDFALDDEHNLYWGGGGWGRGGWGGGGGGWGRGGWGRGGGGGGRW